MLALLALLATLVLGLRNRQYRRIRERDEIDADADGIPDIYQHERRDEWFRPAPGQRQNPA